MDQQQAPTPNPSTASTASASSQPAEPPKHPPQPQQQQQQQQPLSSTNVSPITNPNPLSKPSTPLISQPQQPQSIQSQSQPRPHSFPRTLPQQRPHIQHFSSPHSSLPSPSPSTPTQPSPAISAPLSQRGGMAIGVPAQRPVSSPQPVQPFSSIGHQYGGLANSSSSQVRPPVQGMGMMGSLGSSSQMRPGAISGHHQQRPVQSSLRSPSSPNNQSTASQNFQGPGFTRVSTVGSPASNTLQNVPSLNQPWLSGPQGKPPLPNHSYRAPATATSLQQRSHIPRQHHPSPTSSQQHHVSSGQSQQPLPSGTSHQPQEHFVQQFPSSRAPQSSPHQQPIARVQGSGSQKPSSLAVLQPNTIQAGNLAQSRTTSAESDESGSRILSKRSIHELVNQIDPLERLDAEVENILVDIADDFVESITTFGCSLAKHRKSDTLEAKDILVHLERNWNITLPGFSGDEIKTYKKPSTNDIHKERLAVIKKSITVSEVANARNSAGQTAANAKGNLAKAPGNSMVSPNFKTREVA
ncbi:transcription initiation factor TFIID subunit 12 [Tripterygium wilfordii]|uniref:Transcription initiation factor TFIID subunit 12 n=1 Tax=Tripterygium wilfordii TaxID=458696 RepID=A0A7J7CTL1_TRIWF|nr:transcription initiation factor TFIID subunit 12 [Tripterygium wilfordii]KAF5737465.1 transcription initiation factor TFIID subunit 12 [Tripterygium wilfordii]